MGLYSVFCRAEGVESKVYGSGALFGPLQANMHGSPLIVNPASVKP